MPFYPLADIEAYATKTLLTFAGIHQESGLWENISLCSDVLEGAWYLLYDDKKKPKRSETVKKFIRESIDSFPNRLVTESKICISPAVFGPLGAGKSFLLNSLLNWGLDDDKRVENGPLPSAEQESQTPRLVYVKYGKKVQVLYKQKGEEKKNGVSPDVWFPEEELGIDTLTRVNNLLKTKFEDKESLSDDTYIELQGPFPVFHELKESTRAMTTAGHLELEVDVEFVDVPGCGDPTGSESIKVALSKADAVLFFEMGKSERPVSSEDIAQIFRWREDWEFTSRPKFVHVVNDRKKPSSVTSCNFDLLKKEKKEDLKKAWSNFLSSDRYEDERGTLPQLNGEALLEKLSNESEVIYFHSENSGFLESLKNVINDYAQNVQMKQIVHPFLKKRPLCC